MKRYREIKTIDGAQYIGKYNKAAVYDILSLNGLNQIIGHMKHTYASQGTVLYRGQCDLYEHIIPSILHDRTQLVESERLLEETKDKMLNNTIVEDFFKWEDSDIKGWELYIKTVYEAVLQHYGAKTYSMDFVDNHWAALWFSLYRYDAAHQSYHRRNSQDAVSEITHIQPDVSYPKPDKAVQKEIDRFLKIIGEVPIEDVNRNDQWQKASDLGKKYVERIINLNEANDYFSLGEESRHFNNSELNEKTQKYINEITNINNETKKRNEEPCAYLFLMLAHTHCPEIEGMYISDDTYTIDLRKAVSPKFLRPVAQHGWIIKGRENDYEFGDDLICVLRMTVKQVDRFLGKGELLSAENFFPGRKDDKGFDFLLNKYVACGVIPDMHENYG